MLIRCADFAEPQTLALLDLHVAHMRGASPPGTSYALDLTGFQTPDIQLWTAQRDGAVVGMAALKELSANHGEIKSMRTHPAHLRTGVAQALLAHILEEARRRRYTRLSLETGTGAAFDPALRLYHAAGFEPGPRFGDYATSGFNQFLHLALG
jgi:putative acetyltransferase